MIDLATLRTLDYPAFQKVFDETTFTNWGEYDRKLVYPILKALPVGFSFGKELVYTKQEPGRGLGWKYRSDTWRINARGRKVSTGINGECGNNSLVGFLTFPADRKSPMRPLLMTALFDFLQANPDMELAALPDPVPFVPPAMMAAEAIDAPAPAPAPAAEPVVEPVAAKPKRTRKPKAAPGPTREELAAQIGAGLPETEAELVDVVWDVARKYDAAIMQGDAGGLVAELKRYEAVVFKLNGNTFFGSNADETRPVRRLARATAAEPGAAPLWGQTGDFMVSAEGIRARVLFGGLAHLGMSGGCHFEFHIIDLHRPFPSNTGYRSHFTGTGSGMTVVARAQAEFAKLIEDQGLSHLDAWHLDFVGRQQKEAAAFQPGGYLADLEPLPAIAAPVKVKKAGKPAKAKAAAPKVEKKVAPIRCIVSIAWGNPYTAPPAGTDTLPDGRTLWACSILDRAHEKEICAEYQPEYELGSGWGSRWSLVASEPKRWSGARKAQMRRRNLRARLDKRVPLLADLLEAQEIERRPHYFDAAAIDAGDDIKPALTDVPARPRRLGRLARPEGRFEQMAFDLSTETPPATIRPGRTATERATYRARRYCELMARPFVPAPQRVRLAPAPAMPRLRVEKDRPWAA